MLVTTTISRKRPITGRTRKFVSGKVRCGATYWNQTTEEMEKGSRVSIRSMDIERAEKVQATNGLNWDKELHPKLIGKVGVIISCNSSDETAVVRFYTWAIAANSELRKKTLVEVDTKWHFRALCPVVSLYFLNGDRAALRQKNDDNNGIDTHLVTMKRVEYCAGAEPIYTLRTNKMQTFTWKQSNRPADVLIPVYTGRTLNFVLRERSQSLSDFNDPSSARVLHGILEGEDDEKMAKALTLWGNTGKTAHMAMAAQRYPEQVNSIVNGRSPLIMAVEGGNYPAVVTLIAMGGEREVRDDRGNTLLHIASERGNVKILEGLLLFINGEINRQNADGDTCLHIAARGQHAGCVDRIMNTDSIHCNIQNRNGDTALHIICSLEESDRKKALLGRVLSNQRINLNIVNNEHLTPIQMTIMMDYDKSLEMIVHNRPALLNSEHRDMSLLHLASSYGRRRCVDALLYMNADVNRVTRRGRNALHLSVEKWAGSVDKDTDRLAVIQSLVQSGVNVNQQDAEGITPSHMVAADSQLIASQITPLMHNSAINCNKSIMKLDEMAGKLRPFWSLATLCFLASKGANLMLRDQNGHTVIDYCVDESLKDTVEQLAAQKTRSILPMKTFATNEFDSNEVSRCTSTCSDSIADVRFIPCGHRVFCSSCAMSIPLRRCPLCAQIINKAVSNDGIEIEMGSDILRATSAISSVTTIRLSEEDRQISQNSLCDAKKNFEIDNSKELQELKERLEQLEMETSCAICMDARNTVVFSCGHTACGQCTEHLKLCHICRQPITKTQIIYT